MIHDGYFFLLGVERCLYIQLFRESLSGKVHATIIPKGVVGSFKFTVPLLEHFLENLKKMARDAMDVCSRVINESHKSRFDCYSVRISVLIIFSRALFSDNLSQNSCIQLEI